MADDRIEEAVDYVYEQDTKLGFCGHDIAKDSMRSIIRIVFQFAQKEIRQCATDAKINHEQQKDSDNEQWVGFHKGIDHCRYRLEMVCGSPDMGL